MPADELARSFARCFQGDDGVRVLRHLRGLTLDVATGPDTGDGRLRHLEGQRCAIAYVIAMVARGRA